MNIAVRYYTQSGNTAKIANAIAHAAGVQAAPLSDGLSEKTDLLFLGSSLYKFGCDPAIEAFLKDNAAHIGTIALFGTSSSGGSTHRQVEALAQKYGVALCEKEFACLGHFLFLHKDRPNADDEQAAAQFARELIHDLA